MCTNHLCHGRKLATKCTIVRVRCFLSLYAYGHLTFTVQLPVNVCEIIPQCLGGGVGKARGDVFQTMHGLDITRLLGVGEVSPLGSAYGSRACLTSQHKAAGHYKEDLKYEQLHHVRKPRYSVCVVIGNAKQMDVE